VNVLYIVTERKKLCKRKGFDIVSASKMNTNRKVSKKQDYFDWATALACTV
jgi:hypothetical protein